MPLHLRNIQHDAFETARAKGLHETLNGLFLREQTLIRLALLHSEVSEATQIVKRQGITATSLDALAEECADVLIRLLEMAAHLGLDMEKAVAEKLEANKHRPMFYGTPQEQH